MISIWLLGGLQIMGIGVIGEYIGKIYDEVKGRPKYAIDIDLYSESLIRVNQDHQRTQEQFIAKR